VSVAGSVMIHRCLGATKRGKHANSRPWCVLSSVTEGFVHSTPFPIQSLTRQKHSVTCTSHVNREVN